MKPSRYGRERANRKTPGPSSPRRALAGLLALALCGACAARPSAKEQLRLELQSQPACPVGSSPGTCFPAPLKAPPLVVGPGRIRVLVWDREAPQPFATPEGFLLLEISDTGFTPIARGLCPQGTHPESLGQIAAGRSAVLCRGVEPVVYVGTLQESGAFDWRWKQTILLGPEPGAELQRVPLFADLGERLALIFTATGAPGVTAPWALQLGPEKAKPIAFCEANEACPIVALVVSDGTLHVIFGAGVYKDLMVTTTGLSAVGDPLKGAKLHPGELAEPCLSQAKDGKVTIQLPVVRAATGDTPDAPARREAQIATLEYERAWLPHGPDVFPTELATCGPRGFRDDGAGDVPISLREGVRATFDQRWLVVYGLPEVPAESYRQQLFPKRGGPPRAYPGSVRVLRGSNPISAPP
jgi:hypothetical protein